ncbi:MAG: chorismate lyase [Endomicrobium sp.]|jgi:chorismate-pyruvate lyase|nr:chorismate lyase [Endomicrobium sp.]
MSNINAIDKIKKLEAGFGKISGVFKILLFTDGSVTAALEALYANLSAKLLKQEVVKAAAKTAKLLDARRGSDVNVRKILMHRDGSPLMAALSYTAMQRLPEAVKKDLTAGNEAIGKILKKHNIETRRELLSVGADIAKNLLHRKYVIISSGQKLIYIEEKFYPNNF